VDLRIVVADSLVDTGHRNSDCLCPEDTVRRAVAAGYMEAGRLAHTAVGRKVAAGHIAVEEVGLVGSLVDHRHSSWKRHLDRSLDCSHPDCNQAVAGSWVDRHTVGCHIGRNRRLAGQIRRDIGSCLEIARVKE
jgi:hypothetical protein